MTNSTLVDNYAFGSGGVGGGISNGGTLTVTNSTFSSNNGDGVNGGLGGGIYNYNSGTVTVTTSTFAVTP